MILVIVLVDHRKSLILVLPNQDSGEESYLFVNKTKICKFKTLNNTRFLIFV